MHPEVCAHVCVCDACAGAWQAMRERMQDKSFKAWINLQLQRDKLTVTVRSHSRVAVACHLSERARARRAGGPAP